MSLLAEPPRLFDAPERVTRADAALVEDWLAPLPPERALAALPRQPQLASPAKLVLTQRGVPGLLAEVSRTLDLGRCKTLVKDALIAALAWLDGDAAPPVEASAFNPPGLDASGPPAEEIEAGLGALPWRFDRADDGSYRVHASGAGVEARVLVTAAGADRLRVTTTSGLAYGAPHALRALSLYALETSRRLRLTRLSVGVAGAAKASLVWDAIVLAELGLERALPAAVQAVADARALTLRPLGALADPRVAREYLRGREQVFESGGRNGPAAREQHEAHERHEGDAE